MIIYIYIYMVCSKSTHFRIKWAVLTTMSITAFGSHHFLRGVSWCRIQRIARMESPRLFLFFFFCFVFLLLFLFCVFFYEGQVNLCYNRKKKNSKSITSAVSCCYELLVSSEIQLTAVFADKLHHHQVMLIACSSSLSLSRSPSPPLSFLHHHHHLTLSSIASGRSSTLNPVPAQN